MQLLRKGGRLLNKLFNIRPAEWPRFLFLYLILFIINAGAVWGEAIVIAAFLEQVGLEALPLVLMAIALVSFPAIAVYSAFADRISNTSLMIAILLIGVGGIGIGRLFLGLGLPEIAYPFLYLLAFVPLSDIYSLHSATYVNDWYDTRSAKRIMPALLSSARIAGVVAGLSMPLLNQNLTPENIILVWLGALATAACLVWLMPAVIKGSRPGESAGVSAASEARSSYLGNIREGYHYVTESSFLLWMAVSTLLLVVLLALLNYQTSDIMLAELQTTEQISNFTARLTGWANLLVLPFLLFGLGRLISRIGLANANLIYPLTTLAISGGLIFRPSLITAALAYLDQNAVKLALRNPTDNLLYNAVPLRVKGRARAFIGGLIAPVGTLVGSTFLILLPFVSIGWLLSAMIGLAVVAYVLSTLVIRKQYTQALIEMLEQEDFSFLLSQEPAGLIAADPATLNLLKKKMAESPSDEFAIFMAQLMAQIGGKEAVPILAQAAKTASKGRLRAAIIEVLVAAEVGGEAVRQLYTDCLADPDNQVRQAALVGLEQLTGPRDEQFIAMSLNMLSDPNVEVPTQALSGLARSGVFYSLTPAVTLLEQLLGSPDPYQQAVGVRTLGQIQNEQATYRLVEYLSDSGDEVRLEAALAIEALTQTKLSDQTIPLILEKATSLLRDPIERVRQAGLNVLGCLGDPEAHCAIASALTDPSLQVRATAVEVLVQLGQAAIPIVHPQLDSPDPQLRKMAAVTLGRINRREFGDLIKAPITNNLLTIYGNIGRMNALSASLKYPSISVLQNALREQNDELLDEIFYFLTAIHSPNSVKIITESLESDNAHTRANAIEALEALTTPQTAQLIAPLFEPDTTPVQILKVSKDTWDMKQPDTAEAVRQIVSDANVPWLRAIMTFALGEMGATFSTSHRPQELDNRSHESETDRIPPPDPLAALTDIDSEDRPKGKRRSKPADLLGMLIDTPPESAELASAETQTDQTGNTGEQPPLTLTEIEALLEISATDKVTDVRNAAQTARRMLAGIPSTKEGDTSLSTIERIIFLKEVPFFQGMTIKQLRVLAAICEEKAFQEDERIFNQGDPGGVLYVIVRGRVGIEHEKRTGSYARLATLKTHSYFGEMTLFDNGPRSAAAIALQDTFTLRLRREPLITLARQYPDLSLELIKVLSERLRQTNKRIAELTRTRPQELQKLFDQLD